MDKGQSQRKRKRAEEERTKGASTSSFISPEATVGGSGQYDVFLSFSGVDTRMTFTDHLYHSLMNRGIRVFRDDNSIRIGEDIGSEILDAIAQSKISIPVISKNYASSKWCLLELIHIMDREKSKSHKVLPIFYKVAPSDVRHLEGNFGNAFHSSSKQLEENNIQEARQALNRVSRLKGWESEKSTKGYEGELVARVVKTVMSELLGDFQLDVPKQLVGLDGHMKKIMNWIDSTPSINARMIGIYGMGGIGKTTLAKCIYNELSNKFVHVSFLSDVRETTRSRGITSLQSQLISDILNEKAEVSTIDRGINIIKSRFRGTKVLILLDDIDDKNQLDALAREHNWFMAGSMIIVTTRNKAVLDQSEFEVCCKYELNGLGKEHSLLLFNSHAFRTDHFPQDFESISHDIISTMGGLPLALQVVGSSLYKEIDREVWEDVRKQLKSQPHGKVKNILQISYDALEDGHKQIFLDIVCFFIGEDYTYAMYMWEDCGFYPSQAIKELKSRCLIKIRDDGKFIVHDQLRDLGRSIFCRRQLLDKHNGPWDCNYRGASRVVWDEKEKWRKPRFDDLMRAASSGDSNELLSEIRWLRWWVMGSDSSLLTTNLHLPNLSVLELSDSSDITEDWEGWSLIMTAKRLQVLQLEWYSGLRCTPDLSAFTQLKVLRLCLCTGLEHLHPSVGKLKSLVSLDLRFCRSLKQLPEEVGELKDLEELVLDKSGITEIPTSIIGSLRKLKTLRATCDKIRSLPELLPSGLTNLQVSCQSPGLPHLSSLIHLEELHLHECHLLEDIPKLPSRLLKLCILNCGKLKLLKLDGLKNLEKFSIEKCCSIERLDLSQLIRLKRLCAGACNNLVEIQGHDNLKFLEGIFIYCCDSIERLLCPESQCLKQFVALMCNNLVEIRGLDGAKFLKKLVITRCKSMETLPDLTGCEKLRSLVVQNCKKLTQLRGIEKLDLIELDIFGCNSLEGFPKFSGLHKIYDLLPLRYSCIEVEEWCSRSSKLT